MTHADFLRAIIAAIIANPADDMPRLVYADWLEEHGQEARAEFIRAQCELAKPCKLGLSDKYHVDDVCASCDPLSRRADELADKHGQKWLSEVIPENVGVDGLEPVRWFRRGFVYSITLTAEAWLGGVCNCDGLNPRVVAGQASWEDCPDCAGTGRIPGHADALVAATPLEVVRLTTWPDEVTTPLIPPDSDDWSDIVAASLSQRWPRIRFELPPDPTLVPPEFVPVLEEMRRQAQSL